MSFTLYDDDDNVFLYENVKDWHNGDTANFYNGGVHSSNGITSGKSKIRFRLRGTVFRLYCQTYTDGRNTNINVIVDGTKVDVINASQDYVNGHVLFYTSPAMEYGDHYIILEKDNSLPGYIFFDGIDTDGTIYSNCLKDYSGDKKENWSRIDDTSSVLNFSGAWGEKQDAQFYNGSSKYSNNSNDGALVNFKFEGTGLKLYSLTWPSYSTDYRIIIDDIEYKFSLDDQVKYSILAFEIEYLDQGEHNVIIKPGTNGSFQRLYIDCIDVKIESKNRFEYSGKIEKYTIPYSCRYKIEAYGAQGGSVSTTPNIHEGGKGAYISGEFNLEKDEVIYVLVGGAGTSKPFNDWGGGGGGATYIVKEVESSKYLLKAGINKYVTPLIVAAGGGGAGDNGCSRVGNGQTLEGYGGIGRAETIEETKPLCSLSGAGGGFTINGLSDRGVVSMCFLEGGEGGKPGNGYDGGFGGGGSPYDGGGGGGGWKGGDSPGNNTGDGGYSYNSGLNKIGTSGVNSNNGFVLLTPITTGDIYTFNYTGAVSEFIIPRDGIYKLECWGASGGIGYGNANPYGRGGYSCGEKKFKKGDKLLLYVGEDGKTMNTTPSFNGGGASYSSDGHNGGRGGGATDIRFGGKSLYDRIIVAGGGGGAQPNCGGALTTAGHGGGLVGLTSTNNAVNQYKGSYANGGSQTSGGNAYNNSGQPANSGSFGIGANSPTCGAGGGGGWYGGGSTYTAGGGGGSSYIGTLLKASTIDGGEKMPSKSLTGTIVGNTGDGFIRITRLRGYNFQHYFIECDNKKYIPTKQFWNNNLNGFIPVENFVIEDIDNESREFMLNLENLITPFTIDDKEILPINIFKNKKIKINKFLGYSSVYENNNLDNINDLNQSITINYMYKKSLLKNTFIKLLDFIKDFDFIKYDYSLKSNCPNLKIGIFHNGEYYGKGFKVIPKDDIINEGFTFNELNKIEIPFSDFKIISIIDGPVELQNIKLYKKLKPISRKINTKFYKIYYDKRRKRVYLIFNSITIGKLIINRLYKNKNKTGIINSLDDIKERL